MTLAATFAEGLDGGEQAERIPRISTAKAATAVCSAVSTQPMPTLASANATPSSRITGPATAKNRKAAIPAAVNRLAWRESPVGRSRTFRPRHVRLCLPWRCGRQAAAGRAARPICWRRASPGHYRRWVDSEHREPQWRMGPSGMTAATLMSAFTAKFLRRNVVMDPCSPREHCTPVEWFGRRRTFEIVV